MRTEEFPREWRHSIIMTLFNVGDKVECKNYREIYLLDMTYKLKEGWKHSEYRT